MSGALSADGCADDHVPSLTVADVHNFIRIRHDASALALSGIVQVMPHTHTHTYTQHTHIHTHAHSNVEVMLQSSVPRTSICSRLRVAESPLRTCLCVSVRLCLRLCLS